MSAAALGRFLAPIVNRIRMMVARGVIRTIGDGTKMQVVQISLLADEVKDGVEHFQPYGHTAHPHPGAEAIALFLGGNRDHGVVVVVDDRRHRLKNLNVGDVAIYSSGGNYAILRHESGDIEVYAPGNIKMNGKNIHVNAEEVLRLEGDGVEIHGRHFVQSDVQGKGKRETFIAGTDYKDDTYTTGAVVAAEEHGLAQPAVPSDYPAAP